MGIPFRLVKVYPGQEKVIHVYKKKITDHFEKIIKTDRVVAVLTLQSLKTCVLRAVRRFFDRFFDAFL